MKIAIPIENGKLCPHFGGAPQFAFAVVDDKKKAIVSEEILTPPPHATGVFPEWLQGLETDVVIAGGMGGRAKDMLSAAKIIVITGAPVELPSVLIAEYLDGKLGSVEVTCNHNHHGDDCH
jgi:predicted Fe-Mo cluster-binding NifX family protein